MRIGAVVLAAGLSRRYGQDKLLVPIENRPMVDYAFAAVEGLPGIACAAAVVRSEAVAALARARGLAVIRNETPERGQAHSVALGAAAMRDMDAVLLLAADQPRLSRASLARLIEAYRQSGRGIACLQDETHFGNPAIFGRRYFAELLALSGDRGAKGILRAHEDDLLRVPCLNAGELADVDVPQALDDLVRGAQERAAN